MRRLRPIVALAVLAWGTASRAALAGADAGLDEVRALEKQLTEEHAALSTADCAVACRALASIRRAADRICALEPGVRCETARQKARDATRRVREACPDCTLVTGLEDDHDQAAKAAPPAPAPAETAGTAREESTRGGCRSCGLVRAESPVPPELVGIVLAALLAASRRRRR